MKRILKAFAVIICMMLCTYAYTQTLTVKFTGRDQTGQHYVKLDHVKTFNLDQLWEEVLYFPDTTLVLGGVGIIDYGNPSNSQLEQNVPNPFNGTTHFALYLREGADALLEVFDLMGKTITSQYYANLSAGAHLFSANLTNPQVYILKVTVKNEQMHLKMVNEGFGTENSINYVSVAAQSNDFDYEAKNGQALGIYPFHNGDELQHTGYTVINGVEYKSETITQRQNESETLILPFNLTPAVITNTVSGITDTSAVCGGIVNYTGEATVVNRGICWSTSNWPTINDSHTSDGNGIGDFTSTMTNLAPGTLYHVRAYATSNMGFIGYGNVQNFTTHTYPIVEIDSLYKITSISAMGGGNIIYDGGSSIIARGFCWSVNQNPTIINSHTSNSLGPNAFTGNITSLTPNTTYYVRAYATNSVGTAYSNQITITTSINGDPCQESATLSDFDGNIYNTVIIGAQCWMKENLRTTHFTNGDYIQIRPSDGGNLYTGYRDYPNSNYGTDVDIYGYLYNGWAANSTYLRQLCPLGWHLPTDAEWTQLTDYISSQTEYSCDNDSTKIAKALASSFGWKNSDSTCAVGHNTNANNITNFSVLPADGGSYTYQATLWSNSVSSINYYASYYTRILYYDGASVIRSHSNSHEYASVRCLRD